MKKKWLSGLLALFLLLVLFPPMAASAAEDAVLLVEEATGIRGETVSITVTVTGASSGNFNISYDPAKTELVGGELENGLTGFLNLNYAPDKIRVSFAGLGLPESFTACTLRFRVLVETPTQGAPLTVESLRLYDPDGVQLPSSAVSGKVCRASALLSISSSEAISRQGVRAEISLGGALSPAGGGFTLRYDPALLEPTGVLGLDGLDHRLFAWQLTGAGTLRISFAGTEPIPAGKLCAVVFRAIGEAGKTSDLTLLEAAVYDENGSPMDVETGSGSISIVLPGENDPKLWLVGGAIREDGTAALQVLLEGRGQVCGGQFALKIAPSLGCSVTEPGNCSVHWEEDALWISFASETSFQGETPLLTLSFSAPLPDTVVDFADGSVILYNEDSQRIPVVDLRPCSLSAAAGVTAVLEEEDISVQEVTSSGTDEVKETVVTVTTDIADMRFFEEEESLEKLTVILALYQNGRLSGLVSGEVEFSKNGISSVSLSAEVKGEVNTLSLFYLEDRFIPLCGNLLSKLN